MRYLILILFISTASASPQWVKDLRSGETAMQVENNGKLFFRNIVSGDMSKEELCEASVQKNIRNVRRRFPRASHIPMVVQLKYYDKKHMDCATTVIVDTERMHTVSTSECICKNSLVEEAELFKKVKEAKERIRNFREDIKNNIYVGMNIKEVREILNIKLDKSMLTGEDICYNMFRTAAGYKIKNFVLCWNSFGNNATITGVCKDKLCFENKL